MVVVYLFYAVLTLGYASLMVAYIIGWTKQKEFMLPAGYRPHTFVSVIVPARNEEENIGNCISSILLQTYPAHLFEVIVVDDHSEDRTAAIVRGFDNQQVKCVSLAEHLPVGRKINAYKKAALAAGISAARGNLIVTTDADCIAGPDWLINLACIFEKERPEMIVAPVVFARGNSLCTLFQTVDFMGMQGVTAATNKMKLGNMSNGANLAFSKAVYEKVKGYEGIDHLASGDDYLLMMKISQQPGAHIAYLKSQAATVSTLPQPGWLSFLQQRIRWASKSGKYDDRRLTAVLLLVYIFNVSFVFLGICGFVNPEFWKIALWMLAVKIVVESAFMLLVTSFFKRVKDQIYFPFLQPLHIIYISLAGFLGLFGSYKWKDRKVK